MQISMHTYLLILSTGTMPCCEQRLETIGNAQDLLPCSGDIDSCITTPPHSVTLASWCSTCLSVQQLHVLCIKESLALKRRIAMHCDFQKSFVTG